MRLETLSWGKGSKTAILVHGLSARAALWAGMASQLAASGYRVLAPDLRGHGRSPRGAYSVEAWVADVLENLPAAPDLAIGHSLGGIILIEAVFLEATGLSAKRAVCIDPPWIAPSDASSVIAEFEARKALSRDAIAAANPSWSPREIDLRHEGFRLWDATTARAFVESRRADYTPSRPPPQPSLLILPDPSPLAPPSVIERVRNRGWDVEVFPGAGHYVHLDQRAAVLDRLLHWLSRV
jgi:pimeloyl-ACP methyl ester carboxylesterase